MEGERLEDSQLSPSCVSDWRKAEADLAVGWRMSVDALYWA